MRNNTTNGPNQNINLSLLLRCANIGKSKKRIYGAYTTSDEMKLLSFKYDDNDYINMTIYLC